jgi:glycosyltransferase involved in cell wall biosynthesis
MMVVYLDVIGKLHSLYKTLLVSPPSGYRFVTATSSWDTLSTSVSHQELLYSLQMNVLARLVPPNLVKAYVEGLKQKPREAVLTYSAGHLVFRKDPWVVDMEFVTQLTGYNYHHFKRLRGLIERVLASEYCKQIICWNEAGKKTILLNTNFEKFEKKIEVVPLAVKKKNFIKKYNNEKIKLLFVGSANIPGEFEYKGGKEVLEAFFLLQKKYPNIELIVRSDLPAELKAIYAARMKNVQFIEGIIPWTLLENQFQTADIFLFPTHSTPGLAILDAMSYELPVITTDLWANTEVVQDGKTGFVVKKSSKINYYSGNFIPNWSHYPTSKFMRTIRKVVDPVVVREIAEKTSILIEDEDLRRKMGAAGRHRVEKNFSIESRNSKLKRILDRALEK